MGNLTSFMGKGMPSTLMVDIVTGALYNPFVEKDIKKFEDFHTAILDIFNNFNSAVPGKHYDVPSHKEVEDFFKKWKAATEPEKKKVFTDFMKESVKPSKLDDSTMITGIVTPAAVMAAKKASENVPQLKIIKVIPDVIFVPSATVLALIFTKVTKGMFLGNIASASG
ncbi:hypothetical protein HS088_TW13G01137 [Tripterygium wilfordii]|uniref:Calcium ion binding protein n=1 Tax=Tripterygium wilfordii TaxID=458696 RepID=A0A7J7CVY5_TRIWF|nr:uncharacterized protein LOC120013018 [Tripterygium wilfordii]KAF5738241.1 hypothetical protein HS088_TW13G01137 [Tripterygium wilfordii]